MKISLVIPMYNESLIIADTARRLSHYMSETFPSYEIIFSDDGSTDGSADIVRSLELPYVKVTAYSENRGKGSAVREGVMRAEGELVMFTDADLAYGVEIIKDFYDFYFDSEKSEAPKMMIGSRNLGADGYHGYTRWRRFVSKTYIKLLCAMGGFKLSDSQCGCKAFDREAAQNIFSRCKVDGFAFDFEAIMWASKLGYGINEIPVRVLNHRASKVNVLRDAFRMLRDVRKIKKNVNKSEI